jgi:hypothetical protein
VAEYEKILSRGSGRVHIPKADGRQLGNCYGVGMVAGVSFECVLSPPLFTAVIT